MNLARDRANKDFLKKLYYKMLRIRMAEEKLVEWYEQGLIKAPVHLSIGQEAVSVGVMSALKPEDIIVSTHRCHGHYLAKGGDLKMMMAEILGKSTGCCRGKGGTMHLFDDAAGHIISAPLVGASIAIAVGIALSSKMNGEKKVTAAFFGDGAIEEGIFWESLNFASVYQLPILFVCENNFYATHSPILNRQPSESIVSRVNPHGVQTWRIDDANNILFVLESARLAINLVRKNQPCFIEACTYRLKEHWGVGEDWHLGYRSREEGEHWLAKCPFKQLQDIFKKEGVPLGAIEEMERSVKKEVDEAAMFAIDSPVPSSEEILWEVGG